MTNHDLYRAIGEADETFLLECEQSLPRRSPRHLGIIAALIALMLTACAAPVIARNFSALKKGNIVPGEHDRSIPIAFLNNEVLETAHIWESGSMALQVDRAKDAPSTIEEYYIPAELTDICTVESCTVDDTCLQMEFSRKGLKGTTLYDILYRQYVIPDNGELTVECFLDASSYTQTEKTFGDISFLELSGYLDFDKVAGYFEGRKYYNNDQVSLGTALQGRFLFWSDGRYVYCVKMPILPPHTGNQAVEEMISSLTPVENISQYLTAQ